jgi:hypothetical protein
MSTQLVLSLMNELYIYIYIYIHTYIHMGQARRRVKFTARQRLFVASGQLWCCNVCDTLLDYTFEIDHIKSIAFGGHNSTSNLQALCPLCHSRKTFSEMMSTKMKDIVSAKRSRHRKQQPPESDVHKTNPTHNGISPLVASLGGFKFPKYQCHRKEPLKRTRLSFMGYSPNEHKSQKRTRLSFMGDG